MEIFRKIFWEWFFVFWFCRLRFDLFLIIRKGVKNWLFVGSVVVSLV